MLTGLAPSGASVSGSAALASCSHESAPSGGGATEPVEPSEGGTTTTLVSFGTLAAISGHRSACTTSAFALLSPSTWAISSLRQCQLMGTALAASGAVATDASMNSIELRNRSAMRSPAPTSSSSRPRLARNARSNSSGYVMKRAPQLAGRPGFFSAGADLKAVPGYGPEQQRAMITGINRMALGVYDLPCPVVGAITGHAIAGGLVLALCTDVRVASSEGRYGLTEVKVGVPYPQGAIGV